MHNNGRVGVIIQINAESGENENLTNICKELSLQVASMNPEFIERGDISKDRYDALFAGFEDELQNDPKYSNKPKALRDRILNGKIEKFCREKCLLEQPYIKEESITVGKFLELRSKVIGFELKVNAFARYEKGEGLLPEGEKSSEAYALELAGKGK
jgi:elongation factor Ts